MQFLINLLALNQSLSLQPLMGMCINKIIFLSLQSNYPNDYLTEREEKVVLSVIQWLGTPVGQGFINQLNNKEV